MVYLSWIYLFGMYIVSIFLNIYVYKLNGSVVENIFYNIFYYTATALWFAGLWYVMSLLRKDVKSLYYLSYMMFVLAFIWILVMKDTIIWAYVFACLYALWNGTFWCALHTQELKNIKDEDRAFYSSSMMLWKNVITIFAPLFAVACFFLWDYTSTSGYTYMFAMLPVSYCLSILFIHKIWSYFPKKIRSIDIANFFNIKKYKYWHLYFFVNWLQQWCFLLLVAFSQIFLFKNEITIWLYEAWFSLLGILVLIYAWLKSKSENNLLFLLLIIWWIGVNMLLLSLNFSVTWLILFSIIGLILQPLFSVINHVYSLRLMDSIKHWKSDFYPAMILREVVLWWWRVSAFALLYALHLYGGFTQFDFVRVGFVFTAFLWIPFIYIVYLWEKHEKQDA